MLAKDIVFATEQDEEELDELLLEYGMGIPGEIQEQLIVKDNGRVVAGAKIIEPEDKHFYLEVLGVKQDYLGQGIGRALMTEIVQNPWRYCRRTVSEYEPKSPYVITTVARGYAVDFYKKIGFEPCSAIYLPESFQHQCESCPDEDECKPVQMIYFGGF